MNMKKYIKCVIFSCYSFLYFWNYWEIKCYQTKQRLTYTKASCLSSPQVSSLVYLGERMERLTQKCQSITEHHGWPQIVNEIQVRKAASLTVIPEESAGPNPKVRAAILGPPSSSSRQAQGSPTCRTRVWQRRRL